MKKNLGMTLIQPDGASAEKAMKAHAQAVAVSSAVAWARGERLRTRSRDKAIVWECDTHEAG